MLTEELKNFQNELGNIENNLGKFAQSQYDSKSKYSCGCEQALNKLYGSIYVSLYKLKNILNEMIEATDSRILRKSPDCTMIDCINAILHSELYSSVKLQTIKKLLKDEL